MSRRPPGRATRQILSGTQLTPSRETIGDQSGTSERPSLAFWYLSGLATLVIVATLVWAIWGMTPVSPLLLLLAVGLIASWLVI